MIYIILVIPTRKSKFCSNSYADITDPKLKIVVEQANHLLRKNKKLRVCIIGAGCTGLAALKQCIEDDLDPICLEQNSHIGGLWRYVDIDEQNPNPHSSMYQSAILNTTRQIMGFSDFPVPNDWPVFLPHKLVVKYLEIYADNFKLHQFIQLNSEVTRVSPLPDNRWKVKYVKRDQNKLDKTEQEFDYVMICSGHDSKPWIPKFKGIKDFNGKQFHSHFYRKANQFAGQRVVIVGAGNSGVELASELSHVASQVFVCTRDGRSPWILPRRLLFGTPANHHITRFGQLIPVRIKNYLFEKQLNLICGSFPEEIKPKGPFGKSFISVNSEFCERITTGTILIKPSIAELQNDRKILLQDGTEIENVDVVLYATGYKLHFPFLDSDVLTDGRNLGINSDDPMARQEKFAWLYKTMFPPRYPNIAFLGNFQPFGAMTPVSELQARYVCGLITGIVKPLPSPEEMEKALEGYKDCARIQRGNSRVPSLRVLWIPYCDDLAKEIGCLPTSREIFWKYGYKVWKQYFFGIATPVQYRLLGPQSWSGAIEWMKLHNN
ncbi:hypothetical protein G9A89_001645 [Geosiphon pyriformis]|nr:hypothetical protein G9A89_001645 [Geosiphon pyriformis]